MYIVAIAWIYVTIMMAVTERNFVSGTLTFLLCGVLPLAIIAFLSGFRRRKTPSGESADREVDQDNRTDAERDQ
jgi:biotin transporter BioY